MKNLCFFLICFTVCSTASFGQKLPQKIGSIQTQVDTTSKVQLPKVNNEIPKLEKQIAALNDSLRLLKIYVRHNTHKQQILEEERTSLVSALEKTNRIIIIERIAKEELNRQYDLLKKKVEQKNRDSIQIMILLANRDKLSYELKSYRDSIYSINQRHSKLVKEQRNTSDYQKSLVNEVKLLQNQNEKLQQTIAVLQKENNDQNTQKTHLAADNENLNKTPLGRLQVDIQNAIQNLSLKQPTDYSQNLNKFGQLRQECKVMFSKTPNEEQVAKLCTEVDQYLLLLEKLDKARRALDIPYDSQQVNSSVYELNECKKNKWGREIKIKIDDYIDFLTNYCQLTKDIASLIHDATVAFNADDKDKAAARLQRALDIVRKSYFTHLEREIINRQAALGRNQKLMELPKGNCN